MSQGISPRLIVVAIAALLALPASVGAQGIPGGAANQYTEAVPQAKGERPSSETGNGAIPPQTEAQLRAKGKAGSATAGLAKATAPSGEGDSGSRGLGLLLPLILGASLLAAVAIFARRRHEATAG